MTKIKVGHRWFLVNDETLNMLKTLKESPEALKFAIVFGVQSGIIFEVEN